MFALLRPRVAHSLRSFTIPVRAMCSAPVTQSSDVHVEKLPAGPQMTLELPSVGSTIFSLSPSSTVRQLLADVQLEDKAIQVAKITTTSGRQNHSLASLVQRTFSIASRQQRCHCSSP
eukprot:m.21403 g.21403  ORF g.21403 m.21403 type:complete len:118 (+) comp12687_c0_seq2:37-390(+)